MARTCLDATAHWARTDLIDTVRATPETEPTRSMPAMGDHPTATVCSHRDGALPSREDGARRYRADFASPEWPVGEWLLCAEPIVRRARRAPAAANRGAERARQSLSLSRRSMVPDCAAQRAPSTGELPEGDRRGTPREDPRFATTPARRAYARALTAILDGIFVRRDLANGDPFSRRPA
jgi:hypothetical protein